MRRLLDLETVPGLLALGLVLGLALLPALWLARLGVRALRHRAETAAATVGPRASSPPVARPAASVVPTPPAAPSAAPALASREKPLTLIVPVRGVRRSAVADTYDDARGGRRHHALDIAAPRGTPVLAAAPGRIVRLARSRRGGLEMYLLDEGERYCLYYAHLLRYARGVREGVAVSRGAIVAYVGSSGNAPDRAPHLHFALTRNQSPGRCTGEDVNPLTFLR